MKRLAKLTRPRLHGILPRERLFSLLDQRRKHPAVWLAGPPGAGKTSLVASYIEARQLPALWYDVDGGDSDPAAFFYYLTIAAAKISPRKRAPLPLLASEYMLELAGFARRFFQNLYDRLPTPSVLVLDNYHEVAVGSAVHEVVEQALSSVTDALNVIVISRTGPPPRYSRLLANRIIAQVGFDELRFTLQETQGLVDGDNGPGETMVRALHTQAEGWAAGTTLMLDRLRRTGTVDVLSQSDTMDTVFNYFADQVFNDLPPATRDVLLLTNFLPRVTAATAMGMTGNRDAAQVLEWLYRGHLFTERRGGTEISYRFHALFRAFLQTKASERFAPAGLNELRARAATLLEDMGELEQALELRQEAGDWPAASALLLALAPRLKARGGVQTLKRHLGAMPEAVVAAKAGLSYWLGMCDIAIAPAIARSALERAFELWKREADAVGQATAAAAVVETYYLEWSDFTPLDRWIDELDRLLSMDLRFPSKQGELRARCGMLVAAMSRRPRHAALPACADRLMSMLAGDLETDKLETDDLVTAGTFLLHHFCNIGCDMPNSLRVVALVTPLLARPELSPFKRVVWLTRHARFSAFRAEFDTAASHFDEALAIIASEGCEFFVPVVQTQQLLMSMAMPDAAIARSLVATLQAGIAASRRIDRARLDLARCWIALQDAKLDEAARWGLSALTTASDAGAPTIQALCMLSLAIVAAEQRDSAKCVAYVDTAAAMSTDIGAKLVRHFGLMLQARSAADDGHIERACELLGAALTIAREEGYVNMCWHPRLVAWSSEFALKHGIEVEYVCDTILKCGIAPSSADAEHWPWPVRIHALGPFRMLLHGAPVTFSGKAQKKPLELLKALIALGGQAIEFTTLMGMLWPATSGDAQKSLEMTLSRLRKLLGRRDAIVLHEGKISINARLVWVDVWAFEHLASEGVRLGARVPDGDGSASDRAEHAFALYRGPFLATEPRLPWTQPTADRLHAKFVRLVLSVGQRREATSWAEAAWIYERGLELDNLSEELYRRLMICHREQGHRAHAMSVFRRCRDNLSIILGVAPSADTLEIFDSIRL